MHTPPSDKEVLALAERALMRARAPHRTLPARFVLVSPEHQTAHLVEAGRVTFTAAVSTSGKGIGGEEGSYKTPPGWHRIHARIGDGAEPGAVFKSREATGDVWRGEARPEDLVLTRILQLDGLETGINKGPGCDSLERYIYFHGTNAPEQLGQAVSIGCIRLENTRMVELFDRVREGDLAIIADPAHDMPDPRGAARFHYAGVGGSGMSALAQFQAMVGGQASGSDRGFDKGERPEARAQLEKLGVRVWPQDGSALAGDCGALVVSTAVEDSVPDVAAAKARALPIVHRSEMLAYWVSEFRSVAVSGTSGKSTTTAMVFEILRGAGRDPSVITGGDLVTLQEAGYWGNGWAGKGPLVLEADESDGSLVRYQPSVSVCLNLSKDHKSEDEVAAMFRVLKRRTRERFVCGEDGIPDDLREHALVFGFGERAEVRGTALELGPASTRFMAGGVLFTLPVPGRHNVENALGAIAACRALGVEYAEMVEPLSRFRGVARRFQSLGVARGVEVIDDFGHNPAKIAASLATARLRAKRVLAIYQPHGYGPTRFLRDGFVDTFSTDTAAHDRVWLLEIFYAGGTATRDFSAADLVADIAKRGRNAEFAPSREWLVARVAEVSEPGDVVLVMGARDPSLTTFARSILSALEARA
ncbi:MAG: L,D-transpeptidase family protein [Candidatus Eisenbacteria bacterium]